MRKKIVAAMLAIAVCALFLVGCSDGASSAGVTGNGGTTSSGGTSVSILGAGWYRSGSYIHQSYVIDVKNSNTSKAAEFTEVTITAKDADGKIVKTDTSYAGTIAAGDTIRYAGELLFQGGEPATISASVSTPSYGYIDNSSAIYSSELKVSNVSYINGQYYSRVTGEITNTSNKNCSAARVSVIFEKDGKIIGGTYSYVNNINANSKVPFEVSINESGLQFDKYQVVAVPWL